MLLLLSFPRSPMASLTFLSSPPCPSSRGGAAVSRRTGAAVLASLVLLLPFGAQAYPGRGGGGGGFDRGGGGFGGGGYHFGGGAQAGAGDWHSGYQGAHPMFGPGTRPAWGGGGGDQNINNRPRFDNQGNINVNTYNRTNFNRIGDNNNFYNRNFNGWNDNWRNGGYWNDRPWSTGWFNGGAATWGWWGGNAVGWGLAGLATGAMIGGLVNAAAAQSSPVFLVPQTSYQLNYGSVESVGTYGVSFNYLVNGTQLLGAANCQQGLLNGQVPSNGDQAQLLNAVCQVAYGTGS